MPEGTQPSITESPGITPESPSPSPASPAPSPEGPDDLGFADGGADLDEAQIFADLDETPEAPAAPAAKVPGQPPQAQPTQPTQPVQPPAQQPTQPAQPDQPAQPVVSAEQLAAQFKEWRNNAEHVLSNSHYNLSAEDAAQINVDPGQVIPKLMSRVYLDAVTAAVNVISQALPYTVLNTIDAHNGYQKNEDEFFGEWPGLRDHGGEVVRIGQVFRHLNPKASKADFIRTVGAQAALALGLTAEQARGTRPTGTNNAGQRMLRHVPPAASARHAPAQPQKPANIFEQLAQDTEDD